MIGVTGKRASEWVGDVRADQSQRRATGRPGLLRVTRSRSSSSHRQTDRQTDRHARLEIPLPDRTERPSTTTTEGEREIVRPHTDRALATHTHIYRTHTHNDPAHVAPAPAAAAAAPPHAAPAPPHHHHRRRHSRRRRTPLRLHPRTHTEAARRRRRRRRPRGARPARGGAAGGWLGVADGCGRRPDGHGQEFPHAHLQAAHARPPPPQAARRGPPLEARALPAADIRQGRPRQRRAQQLWARDCASPRGRPPPAHPHRRLPPPRRGPAAGRARRARPRAVGPHRAGHQRGLGAQDVHPRGRRRARRRHGPELHGRRAGRAHGADGRPHRPGHVGGEDVLEGQLPAAAHGARRQHRACGGLEGEGARRVLQVRGHVCEHCVQGREDKDRDTEAPERRGQAGEQVGAGHDRHRQQPDVAAPAAGQGRAQQVAQHPPDGARCGHERGRPSPRRWARKEQG